jgi:hypothetical protein
MAGTLAHFAEALFHYAWGTLAMLCCPAGGIYLRHKVCLNFEFNCFLFVNFCIFDFINICTLLPSCVYLNISSLRLCFLNINWGSR